MKMIDYLKEIFCKYGGKHNGHRHIICPYCSGEIDTSLERLVFACSRHPNQKLAGNISDIKQGIYPNCPDCQAEYRRYLMLSDSIKCNAFQQDGKEGCGKLIPVQFLDPECEVYRISLVGTVLSGKTCFKARLNEEIKHFFEHWYFPKQTHDIIHLEIGKPLPNSTATLSDENFLFEQPDFIGFKTKDGRKIILIIYDFAGEDIYNAASFTQRKLTNRNDIGVKVRKIVMQSDAVFFLIDPEQNLAGHFGNADLSQQLGEEQLAMFDIMYNLLTFVNNTKQATPDIAAPKIAYIFTKLDKDIIKAVFKRINDKHIVDNIDLIWDKEGNPIYTDYNMASSIPNYMPIIKDVVKQQDVRYLSLFEPPPFAKADDIHFFVTSALGMDSEVSLLPGKMPIIQRKGPAFGILDSLFWLIGKQS